MATHDVALASTQRPLFPARCVVCECENPTAFAKVKILSSTRVQPWAADVLDLSTGSPPSGGGNRILTFLPPACPRCARQLQNWHIQLIAAKYLGGFLGVAIMIFLLFKGLAYLAIAAVLLGVILPVVYEFQRPPAFSATVLDGRINYEFLSPTCATEFRQLNQKPQEASD